MWEQSIRISGFGDEIDPDFRTQLETITGLGMHSISVRSAYGKPIGDYSEDEVRQELLPLLEQYQVSVSSVSSMVGKTEVTDTAAAEAQIRQLEKLCRIAKLFSCRFIRVFSFYIPAGEDAAAYRETVIDYLRRMVETAQRHQIILLHENEKGIYGDSVRRNLDLLKTINNRYLRMAFDFANFVQCGEDPVDAWNVLHEYISYYHIKDAVAQTGENVVCGAGDGKIAEILQRIVLEDRYQGYLTLEPHLADFDIRSSLERSEEAVSANAGKGSADAGAGRTGFESQYFALRKILDQIEQDSVQAGWLPEQTRFRQLPDCRGLTKQEMVDILLQEEYGLLPAAPSFQKVTLQSEKEGFCAGKAVLRHLNLTCEVDGRSFTFPFCLTLPQKHAGHIRAEETVPCFILINFTAAVPDEYLPVEEIIDGGFAVLSFCYEDVTKDNGDFTDGLAGVIYPDGRRKPTDCGKIGLWAWAAMRLMDYAMTVPELDPKRISVIGHSRLGKTALLAGALDERFYCAISNDSGCSGAALSRNNTGETVRDIIERFPFWFCERYQKYAGREDDLPFDQHFLLAANAPHRVYVASAADDAWADPFNEYRSCIAAGDWFAAHGMKGFIYPERLPQPGDYFTEGMVAYHLRAGGHYLSREDWQLYMKSFQKDETLQNK